VSDEIHLPTLEREVRKHSQILTGNGERGLVSRTDNLESDVYRDKDTGKPGLVPRVERIERLVWIAVALLVAQTLGVDTLVGLVVKWAGL
jgi:hypothetical protein